MVISNYMYYSLVGLKIKLNIELKFTWADPTLAEKVGNIIRQKGFSSDCVVSSFNFQALTEIKQSFAELTTGFIVFQAAGNLSRMEVFSRNVRTGTGWRSRTSLTR